MKKRTLLCVINILLVALMLIALSVTSFAAQSISGFRSVDGVSYKLSDDGSYYIAVGYSELIPFLTIQSEIDGIPVEEIAESAFHNNATLTEVKIPGSVKRIGKSAFRFCQNLITVELPSSLTYLPDECFYDCTLLKNITLPSSLTEIGDRCFYNDTMLPRVKAPQNLEKIGHEAFYGCEKMIFDPAGNEYAKTYAKDNNLNTDFKNSSLYFFIMMLIGLVCAFVLFFILSLLMKKHIKKHPTHNPGIYIERFFINIGKVFSFIGGKVSMGFKFLKSKLILLINFLGEKKRQRQVNKALEKETKNQTENGKNG